MNKSIWGEMFDFGNDDRCLDHGCTPKRSEFARCPSLLPANGNRHGTDCCSMA